MSKLETQTLIETLRTNVADESIEAEMLRPKLLRQLYTTLGEPSIDDFPDVFRVTGAGRFNKFDGHTTSILADTADAMRLHNCEPVRYCIKKPSEIKRNIIERYLRDDWHIVVQAYNVMCTKFVPHPRHKHLWVFFYVSRDCAKYKYVLEKPNE